MLSLRFKKHILAALRNRYHELCSLVSCFLFLFYVSLFSLYEYVVVVYQSS